MSETTAEDGRRSEIARMLVFENGRRAALVHADADPDPVAILAQLGLQLGRPVLVVAGGAQTLTDHAHDLASRVVGPAVTRAAAVARAVVADGGTASGIMSIVGAAVRERGDESVALLGVAPEGCVTYPGSPADGEDRAALEPNHSHFVLARGAEWGGETSLLIDLCEALAAGAPIAMVVAGGGDVTTKEILHAARRGWPVVVIVGTGGTADTLAAAWRAAREPRPTRLARVFPRRLARWLPERWRWRAATGEEPADEALAEVVRRGDVRLHQEPDGVELARRLAWELQDVEVLKLAWRSFATYDTLAGAARENFERIQVSILVGGIVATLIALLKGSLEIGPGSSVAWIDDALHWTVVALPILIALMAAIGHRLASGKRWVLLRGAAETIKREIYRFRTRTGLYGPTPAGAPSLSPQEVLSAQLDAIEEKLLQTEASSAELTPYSGPLPPKMYGASRADDGLSRLDAERYLTLRVGDQLNYFHPKVAALARKRRHFQFAVLAAGAAGAILAAAGLEIWIGLTTAIAAAALAYLGYLQVESTLVAYNQAAGRLESLGRRWEALPVARRDQAAFAALVADAEAVLETELGGWVQQMNEALEAVQAKQLGEQRRAGIDAALTPSSGSRTPSS